MSLKDMSIYSHLYLCNFTISSRFSVSQMFFHLFELFPTLDVDKINHATILTEDFLYAFVQIK